MGTRSRSSDQKRREQFRAPPRLCTYCGLGAASTRDHIPPKNLFTPPYPQLITVPACAQCNSKFGREFDEHFRNLLAFRLGATEPESKSFLENQVSPGMLQGGPATRLVISEASGWTEITPQAMFYRHGRLLQLDVTCVRLMIERLARGFYRKHFREVLPPDTPVDSSGFGDLEDLSGLAQSMASVGEFAQGAIGSRFQYLGARLAEEKHSSLWIFQFFGRVTSVAYTGIWAGLDHPSQAALVVDGRVVGKHTIEP